MGWENVFQVEIDPFCQRVLEKNFPNTKRYGDIKEFDGTQYRGAIDILTGGPPCQPASTAGKRKGKDDDRWLWDEAFRVYGEIRPKIIVWENVAGIITMGLWDLLSEMENSGYKTESYIIPACAINAIHRRDRVWIIAKDSEQIRWRGKEWQGQSEKRGFWELGTRDNDRVYQPAEISTDPNCIRQSGPRRSRYTSNSTSNGEREKHRTINELEWPTESPVYPSNDGIPLNLVRSAISGAGNSIQPQVAYEIFKAIEATMNK